MRLRDNLAMRTKPLRVLHVINSLQRGGAETLLLNYHHAINRQRIQFDYLLSYPLKTAYEDEVKLLGGKIFRVNYTSTSPLGKLSYLCRLFCFLLTHRYAIIHVHLAPQAAQWPLLFARILRCKHRIIHSHNHCTSQPVSPSALQRIKKRLVRNASDLYGCSTDAAIFLFGKDNVLSGRARVIRNAINTHNFTYSRAKSNATRANLGVKPSDILLGSVARLEKQKNHLFMLEVMRILKEKGNRWVLILIGNGSLEQAIKERADALGVASNVKMVGTTDAVSDYLSAFDLMLMPSLYEGLSLATIEAQAAGLPVLASQGRVPDEAACTDLMHFLPLEDGANAWADWIARFEPTSRKEATLPPGRWDEGFDIATAAPNLMALYEAMLH